jgi:hypothetical protein
VSTSSVAPPTERLDVAEVPVSEAVSPATTPGEYPIVILSPGMTRDGKRYYTEQSLADAVAQRKFDGVPMHWGHEDRSRTANRGHRDMGDRVGVVKPGSVRLDDRGRVAATARVFNSQTREALDDDVHRPTVGTSWVGGVTYRSRTVDGNSTQAVQDLRTVRFVDFVPTGNAGGYVCEAAHEEGDDMTQEELQAAIAEAFKPFEARLDTIESQVKEVAPQPEPVAEGEKPEYVVALEKQVADLLAGQAKTNVEEAVRKAVEADTRLTPSMKRLALAQLVAEAPELPQVGERVKTVCDTVYATVSESLREVGLGRTRVVGNGGGGTGERDLKVAEADMRQMLGFDDTELPEGV